jgi:hypothetical protein
MAAGATPGTADGVVLRRNITATQKNVGDGGTPNDLRRLLVG